MTTRPRRAVLAAVLALSGLTAGCAPMRDLDAVALGAASVQAGSMLSAVERTVEENTSATDDELAELLVTAVDERAEAGFELVGAPGRRTTWHSVVNGSADGPIKAQVWASGCFEIVVDRDAIPPVTATDRPCPDKVIRNLQSRNSEENILSIEDVRRD